MTKRVRTLFFKPGGNPESPDFNVWVDLDPQEFMADLLHDYGGDLSPEAGWGLDAGAAGRYEVRRVGRTADNRLRLFLVKIGGAA